MRTEDVQAKDRSRIATSDASNGRASAGKRADRSQSPATAGKRQRPLERAHKTVTPSAEAAPGAPRSGSI